MKKKFLFAVSFFAVALFSAGMAQAPEKGACCKEKTECCEKAVREGDDAKDCKEASCAEKPECVKEADVDKPCEGKEAKDCCAEAAGGEKGAADAKPCCQEK